MTVKEAMLAAPRAHLARRFAENLFGLADGVCIVGIDNDDTAFVPPCFAEPRNINNIGVRVAFRPLTNNCNRWSLSPTIEPASESEIYRQMGVQPSLRGALLGHNLQTCET